jgi:hypothetical protein
VFAAKDEPSRTLPIGPVAAGQKRFDLVSPTGFEPALPP